MLFVQKLQQLLVCEQQDCFESARICHQISFDSIHCGDQRHLFSTFPQSSHYANLQRIAKLQKLLADALKDCFGQFKTDINNLTNSALCFSQAFDQVFNHNLVAKNEYFLLRQLSQGNPVYLPSVFSSQLSQALSFLPISTLRKATRSILRGSRLLSVVATEYALASGSNSGQLQSFIQTQQRYFIEYCTGVTEHNKKFSISQYLNLRAQPSEAQRNDGSYFTSQFTNFLLEKYQYNAQEQEIFTATEYYCNFWKYFFVVLQTAPTIGAYFDDQIAQYICYSTKMKEICARESLLGYRIWRMNQSPPSILLSLFNPFFLQTFITTYIQHLIELQQQDIEIVGLTWHSFASYLRDYVDYLAETDGQFDLDVYKDYFQYRRKYVELQEELQGTKDLVFDRKLFVCLVNQSFMDEKVLTGENYLGYIHLRTQRLELEIMEFKEAAAVLKGELEAEEKEQFYVYLFDSYVEYAGSLPKKNVAKEGYQKFKQNVLQSIDEGYIRELNEEYLHQPVQQDGKRLPLLPGKQPLISRQMTNAEEELASVMQGQDEGDAEDEDVQEECKCCKGNPYECSQPECVIVGCCTACTYIC